MNYLIALILTILVEALVYLTYKRDKKLLLASVCINIITNPALNLVVLYLASYKSPHLNLRIIIALEILVVVAEYVLLEIVGYKGKKVAFLVFLANLLSFLTGVAIFGLDIK